MANRDKVNAAIVRLNNLYGRGDVRKIQHFADGTIIVIASLQYGHCTFRARVTGDTVRARNHQMTVTHPAYRWDSERKVFLS